MPTAVILLILYSLRNIKVAAVVGFFIKAVTVVSFVYIMLKLKYNINRTLTVCNVSLAHYCTGYFINGFYIILLFLYQV